MAILLTNDDGIDAMGLTVLARALNGLDELFTVAPDGNRSGVSHSITFDRPLRITPHPENGTGKRVSVDGTPADSVRFGLQHYVNERPSLVVSGINSGLNVGVNVFHSGTAAAAREAAFHGINSIAFSIDYSAVPHWDTAARFARQITEIALSMVQEAGGENGIHASFCLNVNIPDLAYAQVKGVRMTRHGKSGFVDIFSQNQTNERDEFFPKGEWRMHDDEQDTDALVVRNGAVSITPLQIDLTDSVGFEKISSFFSRLEDET